MRGLTKRRVRHRGRARSRAARAFAAGRQRLQVGGRGLFLALAVALGTDLCPMLRPPAAVAQGISFGCVGDCDQTGKVTIDELIKCLHGALWGREVPRHLGCFDYCDTDGDGKIQISEMVQAIRFSADGCPADG